MNLRYIFQLKTTFFNTLLKYTKIIYFLNKRYLQRFQLNSTFLEPYRKLTFGISGKQTIIILPPKYNRGEWTHSKDWVSFIELYSAVLLMLFEAVSHGKKCVLYGDNIELALCFCTVCFVCCVVCVVLARFCNI